MQGNSVSDWEVVGTTMLIVYRTGKLPEPEFTQFLKSVSQQYPQLTGMVIVPNRSIPTAAQRGAIKDFQERYRIKAAVVTDSPLVRGVVTAMSWFGGAVSTFAESEAPEALRYAGISRSQLPDAERALATLREAAARRVATG